MVPSDMSVSGEEGHSEMRCRRGNKWCGLRSRGLGTWMACVTQPAAGFASDVHGVGVEQRQLLQVVLKEVGGVGQL